VSANIAQLVVRPYISAVAQELSSRYPDLWAWFSDTGRVREQSEELRQDLLRNTYRLSAEAHPELAAAVDDAAERIGVIVPVELYQGQGGSEANAGLIFVPDRAIIVFAGPLIEQLSPLQLRAVLGHELAHFHLWTVLEHSHLIAHRLLDALVAETQDPVFLETSRRLSLQTELFCDHGALLAARDLHAAVEALVVATTSFRGVSGAAFIAQAEEVLHRASGEVSHPETHIRARSLALLASEELDKYALIDVALAPENDIANLDLLGRSAISDATRAALYSFCANRKMCTDDVLVQTRKFFPDSDFSRPVVQPANLKQGELPEATKRYLTYILLDIATADNNLLPASLSHAYVCAEQFDGQAIFAELLKTELKMTQKAIASAIEMNAT
jgi:hypothetical protein